MPFIKASFIILYEMAEPLIFLINLLPQTKYQIISFYQEKSFI